MPFLDTLHAYFDAERSFGLFFIAPAGLALLCVAAMSWITQSGGFRWGLSLRTLAFGLLMLAGGVSLGLRTPGQVGALLSLYEASPASLLAEELPRMERVNANWPILLGVWTTMVLGGLGLRFGLHRDWAEGLGIALVLLGGVGLVIDSVSERRAEPYTAALEELAQAQREAN